MKTLVGITMMMLALGLSVDGHPQFWRRVGDVVDFPREAILGAHDMHRAWSDMREANWRNADLYFHARGNYDAANRGNGGRWAAEVISNGREWYKQRRGGSAAESARDQEANEWGRNGGDPNVYRPEGLPPKY